MTRLHNFAVRTPATEITWVQELHDLQGLTVLWL